MTFDRRVKQWFTQFSYASSLLSNCTVVSHTAEDEENKILGITIQKSTLTDSNAEHDCNEIQTIILYPENESRLILITASEFGHEKELFQCYTHQGKHNLLPPPPPLPPHQPTLTFLHSFNTAISSIHKQYRCSATNGILVQPVTTVPLNPLIHIRFRSL